MAEQNPNNKYEDYLNKREKGFRKLFQRAQAVVGRALAPFGKKSKHTSGTVGWEQRFPDWDSIGKQYKEKPLTQSQLQYLNDKNFDFIKVIGSGGYGEVWQVNAPDLNKVLACKVMSLEKWPKKYYTLQRAVKYLLSESEIQKELKHPNIVNTEHIMHLNDEETGFPYILVLNFMDLCDGDLKSLIYGSQFGYLTPDESLEWFAQVVAGLKYMHDINVSHLDIKPHNILYQKDSQNHCIYKLSDFGISKKFLLNQPNVARGKYGTPRYMAPEIAITSLAKTTFETKPADIYSLGITLCESLIGKNGDTSEVIDLSRNWNLDVFHKYQIDDSLADLIVRMTDDDPKTRIDINGVCEHSFLFKAPDTSPDTDIDWISSFQRKVGTKKSDSLQPLNRPTITSSGVDTSFDPMSTGSFHGFTDPSTESTDTDSTATLRRTQLTGSLLPLQSDSDTT